MFFFLFHARYLYFFPFYFLCILIATFPVQYEKALNFHFSAFPPDLVNLFKGKGKQLMEPQLDPPTAAAVNFDYFDQLLQTFFLFYT